MKVLKQALDHGLILGKIHRVIEFDQPTWLKPYVGTKKEQRTRGNNDFGKNFLKLMNNSVFVKTMRKVRKHRDIKLLAKDKPKKMINEETV